jgi:RNA polymerase sigma factor for flagellar operon FliA
VGLGEDRGAVLAKYGAYVRSLALTVRRQFHAQLDLEELISWGQVGLFEAAERFDPKVGANFLTFAHYRIKGSIFDGLRKMGILRGSDVRMMFVGERANAYLGNLNDREFGGRQHAPSVHDDVSEISSAATGLAVVFASGLAGAEDVQLADESIPADQRLEFEQLRARVKVAIGKLPDKERKLLEGYYYQGKTLEQAGGEIGQSKSWASRLHTRAVERLREMLDEETRSPAHGDASLGRGPQGSTDRSGKRPGAKPR